MIVELLDGDGGKLQLPLFELLHGVSPDRSDQVTGAGSNRRTDRSVLA
jgi:hypothetical protein